MSEAAVPALTPRQGAIVSAYTGVLLCSMEDLHQYIEEKLGRSIMTHEFPILFNEIQEKTKSDFLALMPASYHADNPV